MPGQTHRTDIQVRFSDTDALGHVNNASFATYAESGRLAFFEALGTAVQSLILANLSIDFRRQIKLGEAVYVESWVERIGNSSMSVSQRIFAGGEVAADIGSTVVYFDYSVNRPASVPPRLREALAAYQRPAATS